MRHNKNAIGEKGNGKPPHEFHFPRKNSEPRLWFLLRIDLSMLNTIGEEGKKKPPHECHFIRKNSEPRLWFLLRSKSSMQRSLERTVLSYVVRCMPPQVIHLVRVTCRPFTWTNTFEKHVLLIVCTSPLGPFLPYIMAYWNG